MFHCQTTWVHRVYSRQIAGEPMDNQQGFTLIEVVVAIAVGILLLSVVVNFCSKTARIVYRLKVEREIRDSGLLAVESIEKSFRKVLEYGGKIADISDTRVRAVGPTCTVSLEATGDMLELTVSELKVAGAQAGIQSTGGSENTITTCWPGGNLKCSNVKVKALVGDGYVDGSDPDAHRALVIVIQFELGEDVYEISRPFKAAFAVYGARGG